MARMLAAKASLLARIDYYSDSKDTTMAKKVFEYLESKKIKFEKIKKPQVNMEKFKIKSTVESKKK